MVKCLHFFLASIFYKQVVSYLHMQIEKVWRTHLHKRTQKQCFVRNLEKTKKTKLFGEVLVSGPKMGVLVFLDFFWG